MKNSIISKQFLIFLILQLIVALIIKMQTQAGSIALTSTQMTALKAFGFIASIVVFVVFRPKSNQALESNSVKSNNQTLPNGMPIGLAAQLENKGDPVFENSKSHNNK